MKHLHSSRRSPESRRVAGTRRDAKPLPQDDARQDSLSFLDLFYAVPVGDLAVRVSGASLDRVTSADWSTIAIELALIIFSWVGFHKNRADIAANRVQRGSVSTEWFFSWRFLQFIVEVAIIGLYFMVDLTLQLPTSTSRAVPVPSERWVAGTLVLIYVAYFVWDRLDIHIAHTERMANWKVRSRTGGVITIIFLAVYLGGFWYISEYPQRTVHRVLVWNLVLIVTFYGYRVAQEEIIAWRLRRFASSSADDAEPSAARSSERGGRG